MPIEPHWTNRLWWRLRKKPHRVAVYDTRPEVVGEFEPYFVAICECGWLGDTHATAEPAFSDAHAHAPDVAPEPIRPLGQSG